MKSVMSLLANFVVFALVLTPQTFVSIAHAKSDGCEVIYDHGYTRLFMGTGDAARSPTMEEVFDAMNAPDSTLFADLELRPDRTDQPRVYIEAPKAPFIWYYRSVPSPNVNDPACKVPAKGQKPITGYECRVKQLKADPRAGGLPKGIKTGIAIAVPSAETKLLLDISKGLGCKEVLNEDGSPAVQDRGAPIQLVSPSGGSGAAAKTKP